MTIEIRILVILIMYLISSIFSTIRELYRYTVGNVEYTENPIVDIPVIIIRGFGSNFIIFGIIFLIFT